MVLPDSGGVSRVPPYSGIYLSLFEVFAYGAITLSGRTFQSARLTSLINPGEVLFTSIDPTTPFLQRKHAITQK